jgi:hypothetical protein
MKIPILAAFLLLPVSLAAQRHFQAVSEDRVPGYSYAFFQHFSPDLKYSASREERELVIHTVATAHEKRIAVGCDLFGDASWSSDGRFVFYVCLQQEGAAVQRLSGFELRRHDLQTGQSDSPFSPVRAYPQPSPNGEHISFSSGLSIMVADANGKAPRALSGGAPVASEGWNADGSAVLARNARSRRLSLLSIADGSVKELAPLPKDADFYSPEWLADGSGFFFILFREEDSRRYRSSLWTDAFYTWRDGQVWFCTVPSGNMYQVMHSAPGYLQLNGISSDGATLMAVRNVYPPGFWELAAGLFGQTLGHEMPKLVRLKLMSK